MPVDTLTAPATQSGASTQSQSAGNSYGTDNVERVEGPLKTDFGSSFDEGLNQNPQAPVSPVENKVPVNTNPEQTGQLEKTVDVTAPATSAPVEDEVQKALDYYEQLSGGKQPDETGVVKAEEVQPANPTAITQAISTIGQDKTKAALLQLGYSEAQAGELLNAPILAGRHGAEIGQLRKENQTFSKGFEMLKPVLQIDPATGDATGFDGLALLEMATKQYGADEVQRQLSAKGVKLVPLDWQPSENPKAAGNKARVDIAAQVAKEFGINTEGLTPEEVRAEIDANLDAKDTFVERLAEVKYQNQRQAEVQVQKTQVNQTAEREQVRNTIQAMEREIPHFKELEPVMTSIYQQYFGGANVSKAEIVPLLRAAAEGLTVGKRLPALIASVKKQAEKALLIKLGIPDSEINISNVPSRQGMGETPIARRNPMEFDPTRD